MGDKLLLTFGANFFIILHVKSQIAIPTFGAKFLDTISKSETHDRKRNRPFPNYL